MARLGANELFMSTSKPTRMYLQRITPRDRSLFGGIKSNHTKNERSRDAGESKKSNWELLSVTHLVSVAIICHKRKQTLDEVIIIETEIESMERNSRLEVLLGLRLASE